MMRLERDAWNPDRYRSRGYSRLVAALTVALVLVFVAAWVSLGFAAVAHAAETVTVVKAAPPAAAATPAAAAKATDFKVNLNLADTTQLAMVPGIGPSKAKAIVAFRAGKSFQSPADVMKVKGIGPKNYAKMKVHLVVDGPAVQGAPPRR